MSVQQSFDLYRIKSDRTPNAVVRDLALLGQIIDVLARPAEGIRDYCGTNQFRQTRRMGFITHCRFFCCQLGHPASDGNKSSALELTTCKRRSGPERRALHWDAIRSAFYPLKYRTTGDDSYGISEFTESDLMNKAK